MENLKRKKYMILITTNIINNLLKNEKIMDKNL